MLRVRIARGVVRTLWWTPVALASVLCGDFWSDFVDEDPQPRSGSWPAHLALGRTTGRHRRHQSTLSQDMPLKLRTANALVPGSAWLPADDLAWAPNARWRNAGARETLLLFADIREVELVRLRGRSVGVVVRELDGDELWLWIRGSDARGFVAALRAA